MHAHSARGIACQLAKRSMLTTISRLLQQELPPHSQSISGEFVAVKLVAAAHSESEGDLLLAVTGSRRRYGRPLCNVQYFNSNFFANKFRESGAL